MIIDALQSGKKVLFFGNGGSAADAQHMAGEFVSKFMFDRNSLQGCTQTDSSVITAVANIMDFNIYSADKLNLLELEEILLLVFLLQKIS